MRETRKIRWEKKKGEIERQPEDWHDGEKDNINDAWVEAEIAEHKVEEDKRDTSIPF